MIALAKRPARRRACIAVAAVVVSVALTSSCSSSSKEPSTTTPAGSGPTATLPGTAAGSGKLPATGVSIVMSTAYRSQGKPFDAKLFRVTPGSVTAEWYRIGDFWAVYFRGLDELHGAGKCPGASVTTASGIENIAKSPYGANACNGMSGTILPPGSLYTCGPNKALIFKTQIPTDSAGKLTATLEQGLPDHTIQAISGEVLADAQSAPEINQTGCFIIA